MPESPAREIIAVNFTGIAPALPCAPPPRSTTIHSPTPSALFAEASASLGADLRAIRKARGQTLTGLAKATGRSVGWLSQVERDLSLPTIDDLADLSRALDVPLSRFFGQTPADPSEAGRVVRAANRRRIGAAEGLTEELLSPDLTDDFEVIHSTFAPGAALAAPVTRPTTELGTLTHGRLNLTIGDTCYTLARGDSFRIKGEPYTWHNPHAEAAEAIWVIAPPVY